MKYSIILPYYQRPSLNITLLSFLHFYKERNDYEVVIIEDAKNYSSDEHHTELINIINRYKDNIKINHIINDTISFNPARSFNIGVQNSKGKNIILTNPECVHVCNILNTCDNTNNNYKIFGCLLVDCENIEATDFKEVKFISKNFWYQHSKYRNERYHFCSCITRDQYINLRGFDEEYSKGVGFEDNDFVKKIEKENIKFEIIDNPYVYHISHETGYQSQELLKLNKQYFNKKWSK